MADHSFADARHYRDYEEVSHLDDQMLRYLLQHGEPVVRVWAAWGLGIVLGGQSVPDLLHGLHDSPAPGVRRHLRICKSITPQFANLPHPLCPLSVYGEGTEGVR